MKFLLPIVFLLLSMGCDVKSEVFALNTINDSEKVWVFVHLNVREEDGIESYYYYAKLSKRMYDAIASNTINSGFLFLEDVKYWGKDDLIYDYKDIQSWGDIIFRVEDIAKMDRVNVAPKSGMGSEQFEKKDVNDEGQNQG